MAASTVQDLAGNNNGASTSIDNSVLFESGGPDVTIEQGSTQVDPAITEPIFFDIVFSEPINVSTFTDLDIVNSGTAFADTWTIVNSGDDQNFTLQISDVTAGGTFVPTIAAGIVEDPFSNTNTASTSTDNSVTYLLGVIDIAYSGKTFESIEFNWTEPDHASMTLNSYDVFYRLDGAGAWTFFENTTILSSNVTGLAAETFYEFSVVAKYDVGDADYGVDSTLVDGSEFLREETAPNIPLFDPTVYTAVNVGCADDSTVVAMVDGVDIDRNGVFLISLDAGETHNFTSTQFDVLEATGPIFVSGGIGSGTGSVGANVSWHTPDYAGTSFILNSDRSPPFVISVFAVEDTKVYLDGVEELDLLADNGGTFTIGAAGSYEITSDGFIFAFVWGEAAAGNRYEDPMPLFPPGKDLIGFASTRAYLSDNSSVTKCVHSNSAACVINSAGSIPYFSPVGVSASYYRPDASRVLSDDPIYIRSRADSNGNAGAPFMPRGFFKSLYAINSGSTYVAVASLDPCTVEILDDSDTVITTIAMTRSGSDTDAPYFGWVGNTSGNGVNTNLQDGYRLRAVEDGSTGEPSCTFGAWYQPGNSTMDGAERHETILFGTNDFTY